MAAGQGPGKGKTNNPNGRAKGSKNRSTIEMKEFLQSVLDGQFEHINQSLDNIRTKEGDAKYIESLVKLMAFIMPKQTDITSGGDKLPSIPITGMQIIPDE